MSRQGNPGTTPSSAGIVAPVHGPTMPPPKADQTHHQPALASLYQSFKSPKPSNSILHRHSFLGTQLPRGPPAQKHAPAMMESVQHSIIESSRSNSVVDSDDDTLCNEIQSASAGKGTGGNIVAQSPSRVVAMNAFPKPRLSLQEVERPTKRRRIFHAQQKSIDRASTVRVAFGIITSSDYRVSLLPLHRTRVEGPQVLFALTTSHAMTPQSLRKRRWKSNRPFNCPVPRPLVMQTETR
jgi:hypothetical protein